MRSFVILGCLFAAALGQLCPNCPPPTDTVNCGLPDCSLAQNRQSHALWPVQGVPTQFWQCAPTEVGVWSAIRRDCACGTVFNVNENPRRCTFWFDRSWSVPVGCNWQVPPQLPPCAPWCPDCNGPPQTPTDPPPQITPPPQNTPAPITTPPPGGCNCPCAPCIWWPCMPCSCNC